MHYSDQIKVKLDWENKEVTISIRINEDIVISKKVPLSEFQILIAQFNAQMDDNS